MGLPEPLLGESLEESSYVMYQTQLVCYHKGVLDVVVDQTSINEFSKINNKPKVGIFKITDECQICVYSGADAEKKEEDLDREIEKR